MKKKKDVKLFLVSNNIYSLKYFRVYLADRFVAKFNHYNPISITIKQPGTYLVNIKQNWVKNHYFELDLTKDQIIFVQDDPKFIFGYLKIAHDKELKKRIEWSNEKSR